MPLRPAFIIFHRFEFEYVVFSFPFNSKTFLNFLIDFCLDPISFCGEPLSFHDFLYSLSFLLLLTSSFNLNGQRECKVLLKVSYVYCMVGISVCLLLLLSPKQPQWFSDQLIATFLKSSTVPFLAFAGAQINVCHLDE